MPGWKNGSVSTTSKVFVSWRCLRCWEMDEKSSSDTRRSGSMGKDLFKKAITLTNLCGVPVRGSEMIKFWGKLVIKSKNSYLFGSKMPCLTQNATKTTRATTSIHAHLNIRRDCLLFWSYYHTLIFSLYGKSPQASRRNNVNAYPENVGAGMFAWEIHLICCQSIVEMHYARPNRKGGKNNNTVKLYHLHRLFVLLTHLSFSYLFTVISGLFAPRPTRGSGSH